MNSKTTKRALLSSAFAMLLCVAMLIGTTFAWFTDTASTGINRIQAGNLDIGVEYTLDGEQWRDVEESTDLFGNEDALFEPGYTRVVAFRITNKGNLALKYKMSMNLVDEKKGINKDGLEFALSDYLKVKTSPLQEVNQIGDIMVSLAFDRSGSKAIGWTEADFKDFGIVAEDQILSAGQQIYSIMQVYMPESVGNEANAKDIESTPSIDFGINVVATQATVEKDSFDNNYDKDATYPALSQSDLTNAIADGKKNVTLGSGEYTLYNINNSQTQNTELVIEGSGIDKTVFKIGKPVPDQSGEYNADYSYENSDVTFKNMAMNVGTGDYKGIVRAKSLYFVNCKIVGRGSYWGSGKVVFKNCTFEDNNGDYNMQPYSGSEFIFENCVFKSQSGKFINAYKEQRVDTKLNFINCTFDGPRVYAGRGAVCLKKYTDLIWTVSFTDCTAPSGKLWWAESGLNPESTVTVNNTVVWENGAKK